MTALRVAYAPQILAAARRHGLDPTLLAAVAAQETGGPGRDGGRNVVGDGGHGRGLFQLDDRWQAVARTPAAMDPAVNADAAAGILRGLLDRYGGNVRAALSAWNAGSPSATGTRTDWGDGPPLGYADSVLRHAGRIAAAGGIAGAAPASTSISSEGSSHVNLLNVLGGAAQGFILTGGNPVGAIAGGIGGIAGGGGGIAGTGNLGNAAQSGWQSGVLAAQDAMNLRQSLFQLGLQQQSNAFDDMTAEKSELLREQNTLRDVAMAQRKADNEITKEFIRSIA